MSETAPAPRRRPLLAGALVLLLVVGVTAAGAVWWRGRGTELEQAAAWAPPTTERLSWVDWQAVRRDLGVDLDRDSDADALTDFLDLAYEADLSATSALVQSAPALQRELGLSPATIDWEAFTQSTDGALITMGTGDLDLEALGEDLESLGWARPPADDGVWIGGVDLVAGLDPLLTPQLAFLAVLPDEGVVLASDEAAYVEDAVAAVRGDAEAGVEALGEVADALTSDGEPPLAASLLTGENACAELAMAQADDTAQAEAEALLDAAGEVHPYAAIGTALLPDGAGRVAMRFETDDQARTDADSRARLAVGPAPGQGGTFAERFALVEARAEGRTVVLDLDPAEGAFLLSDLGAGPVLYATC